MRKLEVFTLIAILFIPGIAFGQDILTFTDIPFVAEGGVASTENYAQALYRLSIGLAAVLVVVKLMMAGVKYMFSEVVTNKEDAKKDIYGAITGLLIILAAVTILNTINPELTELNFLRDAPVISPSTKNPGTEQQRAARFQIQPGNSLVGGTNELTWNQYVAFCKEGGGTADRTFVPLIGTTWKWTCN